MQRSRPKIEVNPFIAPSASLEAPEERPKCWFRVSLIPASFGMALGVFGTLVAPIFLLILLRTWRNVFDFGPIPAGHPERRFAPTPTNLTALLMFLLMAVFGFLAARAWVEHRWEAALGCSTVVAVALGLLCVFPPFSG